MHFGKIAGVCLTVCVLAGAPAVAQQPPDSSPEGQATTAAAIADGSPEAPAATSAAPAAGSAEPAAAT
ncbi:MAG: ammonia channel protein, partial [Deltaproteobacteria bacterium]|nr:ammonia channel protein [Deltaproteobacteria bacterium]MBW2533425.1 ammonia channel protein [Deltaproteobacteria bacterium]